MIKAAKRHENKVLERKKKLLYKFICSSGLDLKLTNFAYLKIF